VQESWFCAYCKSMNRAGASHCYRCHASRAQATMASVTERNPATVLTPGLDDEHREVAWELMARSTYFSAWRLGYAATALLFLAATLVLTSVATGLALVILGRDPNQASAGLAGLPPSAVMGFVVGGSLAVAVVVHSAFLALTSMDTPGLGSGWPRFGPLRASVWWIESFLWAIRAALAFVVPPFLLVLGLALGGVIFGIVGGVVWFVCAYWLLGDPITCLGKPSRLLRDLHERLAVPGSADSRVVTLWATAWGMARGVDYAAAAGLYVLAVVILAVQLLSPVTGFAFELSSGSQGVLAAQMLAGLVAGVQVLADIVALFFLARVTYDLSDRQRIREKWVLSGLRPGPSPSTRAPRMPAPRSQSPDPSAGLSAPSSAQSQQSVTRPAWLQAAASDDRLRPAGWPAPLSDSSRGGPRPPATPSPMTPGATSPRAGQPRPAGWPAPLSERNLGWSRPPETPGPMSLRYGLVEQPKEPMQPDQTGQPQQPPQLASEDAGPGDPRPEE
jgi:hypothetical protein